MTSCGATEETAEHRGRFNRTVGTQKKTSKSYNLMSRPSLMSTLKDARLKEVGGAFEEKCPFLCEPVYCLVFESETRSAFVRRGLGTRGRGNAHAELVRGLFFLLY